MNNITKLGIMALFATSAFAIEPLPAPLATPPQVDLDWLIVRLPESDALNLLPDLRNPAKTTEATDRIIKMIGAKKATLVSWPSLSAPSGQRAVVEHLDEFRYAVTYRGDAKSTTAVNDSKPANDTPPTAKETPPSADRKPAVESAVATSFETRNIGITLEVEPTVEANDIVNLNFVCQHVAVLGMQEVKVAEAVTARTTIFKQPDFETTKVTRSVRIPAGNYSLVGVFKPRLPEDTTELFLIRPQVGPPIPAVSGK